jgi:hypothetical protein
MLQKCSQLAEARHLYKAAGAMLAANVLLDTMLKAATFDDVVRQHQLLSAGPAAGSTRWGNLAAGLLSQLQQSGLLEQLPALVTDAAYQLQAVAGVWPASVEAAVKARFEEAVRLRPKPGVHAEWQADIAGLLLSTINKLHTVATGGSMSAQTGSLLAGEHLQVPAVPCQLAVPQHHPA